MIKSEIILVQVSSLGVTISAHAIIIEMPDNLYVIHLN